MINVIEADTIDELFVKIARKMLSCGKIRTVRGMKTLELPYTMLVLKRPERCIVTLKSRNIDIDYLDGEIEWYLSGSLDVKDIAKHSKFWAKLADKDGKVNSNYGFLVTQEEWHGKTQYEWCVDRLKEDIETRQAVMNYNQPRHKYEGNKDFVCTLSQSFNRQHGKLDSTVVMRSNDLIYGFTYDVIWFTTLQHLMAEEIGIETGTYYHYAISLHVYEKHFKMLRDIAAEEI